MTIVKRRDDAGVKLEALTAGCWLITVMTGWWWRYWAEYYWRVIVLTVTPMTGWSRWWRLMPYYSTDEVQWWWWWWSKPECTTGQNKLTWYGDLILKFCCGDWPVKLPLPWWPDEWYGMATVETANLPTLETGQALSIDGTCVVDIGWRACRSARPTLTNAGWWCR